MNILKNHAKACCCLLFCVMFVSCPPQTDNRVSLETDQEATAAIGAEGGTVEATATDGTVYTLTIPADAMPGPVTIKMTPVSAIADLPLAGGLAGGVELQPTGLRFTQSATLTIATSATPPSGQIPIGFSYEGDAETLLLAAGGLLNGILTVSVQHFSGAGIGFGTLQNVSALVPPGISNLSFLSQLLAADPAQRDAVNAIMRQWFSTIILPQLQNAANDAELAVAISDYSWWKSDVPLNFAFSDFPDSSPLFATEREQAAQAAAPQLRAAIDGNNALCGSSESFSALANVLFWQKQAALFGVDTSTEQLDRATVLLNLCVEIVMDPPSLPDNLQVGFPQSLDLRFGVRFKGNLDEQGAPFEVNLTATGATLGTPSGFTAVDGSYTTVVTATGNGPVTIEGTACLILPGTVTPTDICFPFTINRNGLDISGTYTGYISYSSALFSEYFDNTLLLTQNQNAISGSYEGTSSVLGALVSGTITGTLATTGNGPYGIQLLGFEATQSTPCPASMRSSTPVDVLGALDHVGFEVQFDDFSGCPACLGHPEQRFCATEARFVFNK